MKVLITDKMAEEAIQLFKDAGHDVTYDEIDAETLLAEIPKYDALMVRKSRDFFCFTKIEKMAF